MNNLDRIIALAQAGFSKTEIVALMTAPAAAPAAAAAPDVSALIQQAVQASFANFAQQPKTESVDDIIAHIINPPMPKKDGE